MGNPGRGPASEDEDADADVEDASGFTRDSEDEEAWMDSDFEMTGVALGNPGTASELLVVRSRVELLVGKPGSGPSLDVIVEEEDALRDEALLAIAVGKPSCGPLSLLKNKERVELADTTEEEAEDEELAVVADTPEEDAADDKVVETTVTTEEDDADDELPEVADDADDADADELALTEVWKVDGC